jgi:LysM repeat protein
MIMEGRSVQRTRLAIAVVLVGLLSGCISVPVAEASDPTRTQSPSSTPAPGSLPTSGANPAQPPSVVPEATASGECHPWVYTAADDPEQVQGWALQIPVDSGQQEYAVGTATVNSEGVPVSYTVGAGDLAEYVAERFCINTAYLFAINTVRRGGVTLYVGDTLNLDAHTITSVGDQNGVVNDYPVPTPIPPQQ